LLYVLVLVMSSCVSAGIFQSCWTRWCCRRSTNLVCTVDILRS